MLQASELVVYVGREEVARHKTAHRPRRNPPRTRPLPQGPDPESGCPAGATALDQARAAGRFTPIHNAWWQAAVKGHGEREGARALINEQLQVIRLRLVGAQ
ncbi:hypothetical protein [Streptomyces sp. NPDC056707]|uniref:hypothetical protein n=1 Tax=Streptomyces sp. NPDC056707 TaxID=3345919 RepID=UPI0036914065